MARFNVKVIDSYSKAPLPYVHVEIEKVGMTTTGLDGYATFEVPVCYSMVIKVRAIAYRPFTQSVHLFEDRPSEIVVELEKAIY